MTEKLQKLISLAIIDGVITDKEREILLKIAKESGVDLDEFEMALEGKLFERQQDLKAQIASQIMPSFIHEKSTTGKEGVLMKCPSCGAPSDSFSTKCGECGHEYREIQNVNSIERFFALLNELENKREDDETNVLKALGKTYSQMLSGQSAFTGGKINNQKKELIKTFPIPNTKGDLLEFLSLAMPRAKKQGGIWSKFKQDGLEIIIHNELVPLWKTKCEQIIIKARFSMKDDPKTLQEIEYYAKELKIK